MTRMRTTLLTATFFSLVAAGAAQAQKPSGEALLTAAQSDLSANAMALLKQGAPVTAVDPTYGRCGPARAAIFVSAPDAARSVDERALVAAFGLTAREAEVAAQLASGATIGSLAAAWGISANTVRGYLKAVFDKTGTHRQADLVRLVLQGFVAA